MAQSSLLLLLWPRYSACPGQAVAAPPTADDAARRVLHAARAAQAAPAWLRGVPRGTAHALREAWAYWPVLRKQGLPGASARAGAGQLKAHPAGRTSTVLAVAWQQPQTGPPLPPQRRNIFLAPPRLARSQHPAALKEGGPVSQALAVEPTRRAPPCLAGRGARAELNPAPSALQLDAHAGRRWRARKAELLQRGVRARGNTTLTLARQPCCNRCPAPSSLPSAACRRRPRSTLRYACRRGPGACAAFAPLRRAVHPCALAFWTPCVRTWAGALGSPAVHFPLARPRPWLCCSRA